MTKKKKLHEEMLTIPGHKKIQIKIILRFHSCQNGYHQEYKQQQMLVRMWGKRNPYTLLVQM
jgi:hypothetical protein